jgi:probable rRNA maturation factor
VNAVEISVEGVETPLWIGGARDYSSAVLEYLGREGWDLSILFCDDAFIRSLNRQYRGRDEATDVLSFEQGVHYTSPDGGDRFLAGDIVISLETLARNANAYGIGADEELRRLIIHGILHLSNMDHGEDENDPMLELQEKILRDLAAAGKAAIE